MGKYLRTRRLWINRRICIVIRSEGKSPETVLRLIPRIEMPAFVKEEGAPRRSHIIIKNHKIFLEKLGFCFICVALYRNL